ncbi:hypothetical protein EDD16DRAFT_1727189 [Pisolithus croceorrhizus]|nr:hypothetical protein EDD16DRAFT_1727189 [Pisolithus croceorrhizus]KAI6164501.1 hypothetical protein EDD17DRAFT_1895032 [Pisolithus thermaeus]
MTPNHNTVKLLSQERLSDLRVRKDDTLPPSTPVLPPQRLCKDLDWLPLNAGLAWRIQALHLAYLGDVFTAYEKRKYQVTFNALHLQLDLRFDKATQFLTTLRKFGSDPRVLLLSLSSGTAFTMDQRLPKSVSGSKNTFVLHASAKQRSELASNISGLNRDFHTVLSIMSREYFFLPPRILIEDGSSASEQGQQKRRSESNELPSSEAEITGSPSLISTSIKKGFEEYRYKGKEQLEDAEVYVVG